MDKKEKINYYLYNMSNEIEKNNMDTDNEISLFDLFAVLWRRKIMIIAITLIAAIGIVTYSIISIVLPPETSPLPNRYTSRALLLIDDKTSGGGGLASMMGNMGGLAALAGINVPITSSLSDLAVFLVGTNTFLDTIVDEFNLIERYKIEKYPRTGSRKALRRNLRASFDDKSGVLTISFTDIDPVFAKDVVDFTTSLLLGRIDELGLDKNKIQKENLEINITNTFDDIIQLEGESRRLEQSVAFGRVHAIAIDLNRISMELAAKQQVYTQLKIQYELLKVEMASEMPLFQILEAAEIPEQKSEPGRALLCILVTFAAGFFSVFLAFILNLISNIKKDPEAMAKLRGNYV